MSLYNTADFVVFVVFYILFIPWAAQSSGIPSSLAAQGVNNNAKKSKTYKGRLLHYFPRETKYNNKQDGLCGWHLDHGSITILPSPLFLDLNGNKICGKKALSITIELAQEAGALATNMLKLPHDLEYEKTFWPFALLSKKRYVGMLYEFDVNKCKRKSMGIVLKRRDNAPIVKDIYGGLIEILMKKQDIEESLLFIRHMVRPDRGSKLSSRMMPISSSSSSASSASAEVPPAAGAAASLPAICNDRKIITCFKIMTNVITGIDPCRVWA